MLEEALKKLLEFAKATDLTEVAWERNGTRVAFRRGGIPPPEAPSAKAAPAPGAASPPPSVPPRSSPPQILSRMVGTFYRAEGPTRPPLVVEGTIVNAGQPVAVIEAMKIMKDVVAPEPCRIVKALVENGHAVEYGQPLFEIEPVNENV